MIVYSGVGCVQIMDRLIRTLAVRPSETSPYNNNNSNNTALLTAIGLCFFRLRLYFSFFNHCGQKMREHFVQGYRSIGRRHFCAQIFTGRRFAALRDFIFVYFSPTSFSYHLLGLPLPDPYPPCHGRKSMLCFILIFYHTMRVLSPADHQRSSDGIVHVPVLFYVPAHCTETHIRTRYRTHVCVFFSGPLTLPPPAMRGASRMACRSRPVADV